MAVVAYGDRGAVPGVVAALLGVAFELAVLIVVGRRLRWARMTARLAADRFRALRPLAVVSAFPWWVWTASILGIPLGIASAIEMARMLAETGVPFTLGAALAGPATFLAVHRATVDTFLSGIATIAIYAYALAVALGVVEWFERGHRAYFRTRAWIADLVVVVTLTGLLGSGLAYVVDLALTAVLAVATRLPSAAAGTFAAMPTPVPACVAREGVPMVVVLAWTLLPLLALPVASRMAAAVRRDGLASAVGWFPSGREARLLWLTLAWCLVWPYRALEAGCSVGVIRQLPAWVLLAVIALVVVLVGGLAVRTTEPPQPGQANGR
jgi:hypothetical protein